MNSTFITAVDRHTHPARSGFLPMGNTPGAQGQEIKVQPAPVVFQRKKRRLSPVAVMGVRPVRVGIGEADHVKT